MGHLDSQAWIVAWNRTSLEPFLEVRPRLNLAQRVRVDWGGMRREGVCRSL